MGAIEPALPGDGKQDRSEPASAAFIQSAASSVPARTMALDEGRMGSAPGPGQYALENEGVDPQSARSQAIDLARNAGVLGARSGAFASSAGRGGGGVGPRGGQVRVGN